MSADLIIRKCYNNKPKSTTNDVIPYFLAMKFLDLISKLYWLIYFGGVRTDWFLMIEFRFVIQIFAGHPSNWLEWLRSEMHIDDELDVESKCIMLWPFDPANHDTLGISMCMRQYTFGENYYVTSKFLRTCVYFAYVSEIREIINWTHSWN